MNVSHAFSLPTKVRQVKSNALTQDDGPQQELALVRRAKPATVPIELVRLQKSSGAALALACSVSGLEDKEIYLSLGIDAGHWSRIKKGDAGFPPEKIAEFCSLVDNTIFPEWIAYQVGCTLVVIKTEAERRAEAAEARAAAAEAENKLMRQLLSNRAA